jgi:hypothetical protein
MLLLILENLKQSKTYLTDVVSAFIKGIDMSFMVVDAVTDKIVQSNFEYKHHAELFIEVHGKDYPDAELVVESA